MDKKSFHSIVEQITKDHIFNRTHPYDILPIEYVTARYSTTNPIVIEDHRTNETKDFSFVDERSRQNAICSANKLIRELQEWIKPLKQKEFEEMDEKGITTWESKLPFVPESIYPTWEFAVSLWTSTEKDKTIKIKKIENKELFKLKEEIGHDEFIKSFNKSLLNYIQDMIKEQEKLNAFDESSGWNEPNKKVVSWFQLKGIKPASVASFFGSEKSKRNVSEGTRKVYIEVFSHYEKFSLKGVYKNQQEIYEWIEAKMLKFKDSKKFYGKVYKRGHIKDIIEHKLYLSS